MIPDKILKGLTLCQMGKKSYQKKRVRAISQLVLAKVTTDCTFS